jgi:hypothetical protein
MQTDPYHLLPFPSASARWYKHQYTLAVKNASRERSWHANVPALDEEGAIVYISRCQVEGTLQENIQTLIEHAKDESSNKTHIEALVLVGKFILDNWPVVKTQDAGNCKREFSRVI